MIKDKDKIKINELNNYTKNRIKENIIDNLNQIIKKIQDIPFLFLDDKKNFSMLFSKLFSLGVKFIGDFQDSYEKLIKDLNENLDIKIINDEKIKDLINTNNLSDEIEIVKMYLNTIIKFADLRENFSDILLNFISYNNLMNEEIYFEILDILNQKEIIFDFEKYKKYIEYLEANEIMPLLEDLIQKVIISKSRFDSAQNNYFDIFVRSLFSYLLIIKEEFSEIDFKWFNIVLEKLDIMIIEMELVDYFKNNNSTSRREEMILNGVRIYLNMYTQKNPIILQNIVRIAIICLNQKKSENTEQYRYLHNEIIKGEF